MNWNEIKKELQKTWSLLTHEEIEKAKGSLHSLAGTIQKKYGMARHEVEDGLNRFMEKLAKSNRNSAKNQPKSEVKKEPDRPINPSI